MRLFKRIPKECETIGFSYNRFKPEEGIVICFGTGEDKKLPGLPAREIAYHRLEVDELDWLIDLLRDIQNEYNVHSD